MVTLPIISYTSKDYESFRDDMLELITTKCPEWTDTSSSDFGVVLIELFAYIADILSFYQDRMANEAFLPTATQRKSVINLCKLIDYELTPALSSLVTLTFTATTATTLSMGFQVSTEATDTEEAVIFETAATLSCTSSGTFSTIAIQGYSVNNELLGVSNGTELQSYKLDYPGVSYITSITAENLMESSLQLSVDEGYGAELWTEVDNFLDSDAADKVYYTEVDESDYLTVYFGDNVKGRIPLNGSTITANYRVGGGAIGNVGSDTITVLIDTDSAITSVTNASLAYGGADEESIAEAKEDGPASIRVLDRGVTLEDFKVLSEGYPGVAKAVAEREGVTSVVDVYIAPDGGGNPSSALKAAVKAYLDERKIFTLTVSMKDPTYAGVNVGVTVTALSSVLNSTVYTNVLSSLTSHFAFGEYEFGDDVRLGNIYQTIEGLSGVDYCDVFMLTTQPVAVEGTQNGTPTFGTISVLSGSVSDSWRVEMTTVSTFSVIGSGTGATTSGCIGTTYTNAAFSFMITAGTVSPQVGDYWTFDTIPYLGNISLGTYTIATFNLNGAVVTVTGGK